MSDSTKVFWLFIAFTALVAVWAGAQVSMEHDAWLRECEISGGMENPQVPYECIDGG